MSLSDWVFPVGMLTMGYYPDDAKSIPKPRGRFHRKFIVFNDRYQRLGEADLTEMFAESEKHVTQPNPVGASNFAQYTYGRKTGSDFALEMERSLKAALLFWEGKQLGES